MLDGWRSGTYTGAGERVTHDQILVDAQLSAELSNLILELFVKVSMGRRKYSKRERKCSESATQFRVDQIDKTPL